MDIETILAVVAFALILEAWRAHRVLRRALAPLPAAPSRSHYPSVTVIRPIRGLDTDARENIEAGLAIDYPGELETIFVVDDESEPALPLIRDSIAARQEAIGDCNARVIIAGEPPSLRTGKLNAMIAGLRQASGMLIAFIDSDVRAGAGALRATVDALLSAPDAGSAFAPVVAVSPVDTIGDAGYALLLNGLYGAQVALFARQHGGALPFIMGQFMVWRREAIAAIGGLETADGQLVDDMFLGQRLTEEGFRNLVSSVPVTIVQEGMTLRQFLPAYRRWIIFSRSGLPTSSLKIGAWLRAIGFLLGVGILGVALHHGYWLAAGAAFASIIAVGGSINELHRARGGARLSLRHVWVAGGLLLVAPLVLASILFKHKVSWRGRDYALNSESRLATESVQDNGSLPATSRT